MHRDRARSNSRRPGQRNSLRIIGGEWRGRRISFPPLGAIRPTPDRVRETVFNWLQSITPGSRCLDLYAGSGALGLEALSRGAREVVFVDLDAGVCRHLRQVLRDLACERGRVIHADAGRYLARPDEPFDVVFVDPPFRESAVPAACRRIDAGGWLMPGGYAYLEAPAADGAPVLPAGWVLLKSKRAGEVGYHLAWRDVAEGE